MDNHQFDRLRVEVLDLPQKERAKLAHELVASLNGAQEAKANESEFQRRMGNYIEHSRALAAKSLTVEHGRA